MYQIKSTRTFIGTNAERTAAGVNAFKPGDTFVETDGSSYKLGSGVWVSMGSGGGVSDHGALTGLADDDHTQYHNDARGDARYLQITNDLSDVASAPTARTNLGLGTIAVINDAPSDGSTYGRNNGAWVVATGSGAPGGANTQLQYNNSGVFGGTPDLVYISGTGRYIIGGTASVSGHKLEIHPTAAAASRIAMLSDQAVSSANTLGVNYYLKNDSAADVLYGALHFGSTGTLPASETGVFQIDVKSSGTMRSIMYVDPTLAIIFNDAAQDIDFFVEGTSAPQLFKVDAGANAVRIGSTTPNEGGIAKFNSTDGVIFNDEGANRNFRVESSASPHQFYLESSTQRVLIGSATPVSTNITFQVWSPSTRVVSYISAVHTASHSTSNTLGADYWLPVSSGAREQALKTAVNLSNTTAGSATSVVTWSAFTNGTAADFMKYDGATPHMDFNFGGQTYRVRNRGVALTVRGMTAGQNAALELYSFDGDATDQVTIALYGQGTPADITNRERLYMVWNTVTSDYLIHSEAAGTGTVRPIRYRVGATDMIQLTTTGYMGVRNTAPVRVLHVVGEDGAIPSMPAGLAARNVILIENNQNAFLGIASGVDMLSGIRVYESGGSVVSGQLQYDAAADTWIITRGGIGTARLTVGLGVMVGNSAFGTPAVAGAMSLDSFINMDNTAAPTAPTSGQGVHMYLSSGGRIVFVYHDAGTTRYKSLLLTGTGVTWVHGTTAPA